MASIGVMTKNFKFFYELVRLMKDSNQRFVALDFDDVIPDNVGVVITTRDEREKVRFRKVVANDSPDIALKIAKTRLRGEGTFDLLIIGVDPGVRPGVAIIGDRRVLYSGTVGSPERVADEIDRALKCFNHQRVIARVGHGDRTNRNRVIKAIWNTVDDVEIVDERNTTRRTEEPDADAAISIAMAPGFRMPFPPEIEPTPGELRDIQRISRIESGGRMTISADLS